MSKILLAFSNDREGQFLRNISAEQRDILQAFDKQGIQPVSLPDARIKDILTQFKENRNEIVIFHYGGHAGDGALMLNSNLSTSETVDATNFSEFLSQQKNIELVFLNGCSTEDQAEALLDAGIKVVIATSQAINDEVARSFAAQFYQSLATGATITEAFTEASSGVFMSANGNFRNLYWEEEDAPLVFPWKIFPSKGSNWKIPQSMFQKEEVEGNINTIEIGEGDQNQITQDKENQNRKNDRNSIHIQRGDGNTIWQNIGNKND